MTPYERIRDAYLRLDTPHPFELYVALHMERGFVFCRPDFFVMGRPVIRGADSALIENPMHHFPWEDCDAWFIFAFAGNMARLWQVMPWELPFIGWKRLNDTTEELRFVPSDVLRRLCPPDLTREIPTSTGA